MSPKSGETICRICLKDCPFVSSIFKSIGGSEAYIKMMDLASIVINDDDPLPPWVCNECLKRLDDAVQLKRQIEESDRDLRAQLGLISTDEIKDELNDDQSMDHQESVFTQEPFSVDSPDNNFEIEYLDDLDDPPENPLPPPPLIKFEETPRLKPNRVKRLSKKDRASYPCCMCHESFDKDFELHEHIAAVHPVLPPPNPALARVESNNLISCAYCHRLFHKKSAYDAHFGDPDFLEDGLIQCTHCGKLFPSVSHLEDHAAVHTNLRSFFCAVEGCGKAFKTANYLKKHQKNHFETYYCNHCDFSACQKALVSKHMARIHFKIKNFHCQHCQKAYASKQELNSHLSQHHGYEKPFKCTWCEKAYSWKAELMRHMTTHTGEMPFSCQFCAKPYNHRGNLLYHEKSCQVWSRPIKPEFKSPLPQQTVTLEEGTPTSEQSMVQMTVTPELGSLKPKEEIYEMRYMPIEQRIVKPEISLLNDREESSDDSVDEA